MSVSVCSLKFFDPFPPKIGDLYKVFLMQVGQLLKANSMIVEQEFKLLKAIKVPVRSNGILAARFEKEKREAEDLERKSSRRCVSPEPRIQEISIKSDMKSPTSSAVSFLMRMDEDLQRIKQSNRKYEQTSDRRRDWVLNAPLIHPMKSKVAESTINEGKVCGITWHGWLVILLVIGIFIPGTILILLNVTGDIKFFN